MPHWHWHIFTLTWVRAFKSSGGSLCTMNSLQNTRDIAMDIDIDKMFPKGFSSDLTFRPTPFNLWVQGTNLGIDWIPRGWDGSSKMGSQANIFNLWVQETNLEQRPPLGIFCALHRPLLEMDIMQKAFQTCEPAVKDPLSNCISSHCILQMQFRIHTVKSCAETKFSFEQVF